MYFANKKKRNRIISEYEENTGIVLGESPQLSGKNNVFAQCLMNGFLLFALMEGCVGIVLSSFDIPANMLVISVFNMVISLFYAMFYYRKWIKIIGYTVVLAGFSYSLINYGIIIRSGFSAITNIIMTFIQDELDLPIEREYQEYYADRYVSVTMCIIFIIIAAGLMYNIIISEVKGSSFIILTTFPFVQLGLYFEQNVGVAYFALYMMALIITILFRGCLHYKIESKKNSGYREKFNGKNRSFNYVIDGKTGLKMTISLGMFILSVVLVVALILPEKTFKFSTRYDSLKDDTEEFAKQVALVGLYGMFFPGSTGGVSRGRMGDSKYIKFDFQTDLVMVMPEIDKINSVYLRGFVGSMYEDNSWKTFSDMGIKPAASKIDAGYNDISQKIYYQMAKKYPGIRNYFYKISNVAANPNMFYLGYYDIDGYGIYKDISEEDNPKGSNPPGTTVNGGSLYWSTDISYNQAMKIAESFYEENKDKMSYLYNQENEYRDYVYDYYLNVPEENRKVIDDIIKDNALDKQEDRVEAVKKFLELNYEYTLIPGKTPRDKDFVNYFLMENKQGYCMYFASSAVLMLRELGIPSRFVGGYMIDSSDMAEGNVLSGEKYSDWTRVDGAGDKVREIEINDSSAHAWIEVYVDKFGWIPVDVTPPSEEDSTAILDTDEKESTFGKIISTIFSPETAKTVRNTTDKIIFAIVLLFLIFVVIYVLSGYLVRYIRRKKFEGAAQRHKVFEMARYMFRLFERVNCKRNEKNTYLEYGRSVSKKGILDEEKIFRSISIYEKAKYSPEDISEQEYKEMCAMVFEFREQIYSSLKWYKKIIFKYVLMM